MDSVLPEGRALPQPVPCRLLISLDFDGTLWQPNLTPPIPGSFFEMMQRWRLFGVRWGINTGRTMEYLLEDWIPCTPYLPDFICTCERFVYLADSEGRLRGLVGHNRAAMAAAATLQARMAPLLHAEMARISALHPHLKWIIAPADPLSVEAEDSVTMDELAILLQPLLDAHPDVSMQRAGRYMRLSDARFHKGSALAHVADAWRVDNKSILIAGDGHNDIDSFVRFPGACCAAPADAHPDVRDWLTLHGGYISPESGILQILIHWGAQMNLPYHFFH